MSFSIKLAPITSAIELALATGMKRLGSSPPSPVLDLPPMRFIAIANVACASVEIEPKDIAPVAKRLTISFAGSTSSKGTGAPPDLISNKLRKVIWRRLWSLMSFAYSL